MLIQDAKHLIHFTGFVVDFKTYKVGGGDVEAVGFQHFDGFFVVVGNGAEDAVFHSVGYGHGLNIDTGFLQDAGKFADPPLSVLQKYGDLID